MTVFASDIYEMQLHFLTHLKRRPWSVFELYKFNMSSLGPPGAQINPEEADNFEEVRRQPSQSYARLTDQNRLKSNLQ